LILVEHRVFANMDLPLLQQVSETENVEPKKRPRRRRWKDGNFNLDKTTKKRKIVAKLKKLMEAASKARERRPQFACASRTVELITQTDEAWRESTSKSAFLEAVGLTLNSSEDTPEVRCLVELQSDSSGSQRTRRPSISSLNVKVVKEDNLDFTLSQKETIPEEWNETLTDSETQTVDLSLDEEETEWEDRVGSETSPTTSSCDPEIGSLDLDNDRIEMQQQPSVSVLPVAPTEKPYPHPVFNQFIALWRRIHAREKTYEQMGQFQRTVTLHPVSESPNRRTPESDDSDDDVIILN